VPDEPVDDTTDLYRRVHPEQVIWDENDCCLRPTSAVFKDVEMSVHIADTLEAEERSAESVLESRPHHQLVAITAGFAKTEEQEVVREPRQEDSSHGNVVGQKPKGRQKRFVKHSKWMVLRRERLSAELQAKLDIANGEAGA
jgi:hypothetical protein